MKMVETYSGQNRYSIQSVLIRIVSWGFVVNGLIEILFSDWFRNVARLPKEELLFSLLEIGAGFLIVFRWRFSKIVGSFSRIAGLLYAGLALAATLLLPTYKEFQYLSVKIMGLVHFCFYLFCILVLSNRAVKVFFPIVNEPITPVAPRDKALQVELDEKTVGRISFWIRLIAIVLVIDSFSQFFLSFLWDKTSAWHQRLINMLPEASVGFILFGRFLGTRTWAAVVCFLLGLGGLLFPPYIYIFSIPIMLKENPVIAHQFIDRPHLLLIGLIYGVFYFSIFIFLDRPSTKRYFQRIEKGV